MYKLKIDKKVYDIFKKLEKKNKSGGILKAVNF